MANNEIGYTNSLFEESWWLDIVAPGEWSEVVVKDNNRIIARLPYRIRKGVISNPVYTQTLGIWMDPSLKNFGKGNTHLHEQKEIINQLIKQLPKTNRISIILDSETSYVLPFRWLGFHIEPTFSYRIENLRSVNVQDELYGKTAKKNIKAAQKKVSIIESSTKFDVLIRMLDLTFRRQKRRNPINKEITMNLMRKAYEEGHGNLMIAEDGDKNPHSAGFFVFDDRRCYYLLGGFNPDFSSDCSQNLLLDAGIRFAQTVSREFDFEGSMIEGIENFFRQFGGKQVINYHVSRQNVFFETAEVMKPRIKRLIGYKV